jgi:hypothetical protein
MIFTEPINFIASSLVTLSGYYFSAFTGDYIFKISYSSSTTVLINDDTQKLNLFTSSTFTAYFTQEDFYYFKIQLNAVAGSSLNIEISTNNGASFTSASSSICYPTLTAYSPIKLTSCNMLQSLQYLDINTGIQKCPNVCKECQQRIATSSTLFISCTACINSSILISGSCRCETGTVYNTPSNRCKPPNIDRYISYNDRIECLEYSASYIASCNGDCCDCDQGYVKVVNNPINYHLYIKGSVEYIQSLSA